LIYVLKVGLKMQGVICRENSRKISGPFSLSAVNFHGSLHEMARPIRRENLRRMNVIICCEFASRQNTVK